MKYEMKIEFKDELQLKEVIEKSYFEEGNLGKLIGKKGFVTIDQEDPLFIAFKGLNNMTVKLLNEKVIEGSMRCVIDESSDKINLYPINNFCIIEQSKYSFY
jgi:hypothetical protein